MLNRRMCLAMALAVALLGSAAIPAAPRLTLAQDAQEMCAPRLRGMIEHGQTVTGRVDNCVSEELWEFDGIQGQAVVISMERPYPPTFGGYRLDPIVRLLRPEADGAYVREAEDDDGGNEPDARLVTQLRATARYRIAALRFPPTLGDYRLSFRIQGLDANERGTIAPDETVSGVIAEENREEVWEFDGVQGQRVLIGLYRARPLTVAGLTLDPFLLLYAPDDPNASKIVETDDDGGGGVDSLIDVRLEQTGRYRILATSLGISFGEYQLTLRVMDQ